MFSLNQTEGGFAVPSVNIATRLVDVCEGVGSFGNADLGSASVATETRLLPLPRAV